MKTTKSKVHQLTKHTNEQIREFNMKRTWWLSGSGLNEHPAGSTSTAGITVDLGGFCHEYLLVNPQKLQKSSLLTK